MCTMSLHCHEFKHSSKSVIRSLRQLYYVVRPLQHVSISQIAIVWIPQCGTLSHLSQNDAYERGFV